MKMKIEFEVGKTAHNQTVLMVAKPQTDGTYRYDLVRHAANQRDETVVLFDLTDEALEGIAQAHARVRELTGK